MTEKAQSNPPMFQEGATPSEMTDAQIEALTDIAVSVVYCMPFGAPNRLYGVEINEDGDAT